MTKTKQKVESNAKKYGIIAIIYYKYVVITYLY